jgi:hypothetical protein
MDEMIPFLERQESSDLSKAAYYVSYSRIRTGPKHSRICGPVSFSMSWLHQNGWELMFKRKVIIERLSMLLCWSLNPIVWIPGPTEGFICLWPLATQVPLCFTVGARPQAVASDQVEFENQLYLLSLTHRTIN